MLAAVKALPAPGIAAPNRSAQPALIEERAAMLEQSVITGNRQ
jgi:hypothetical protein